MIRNALQRFMYGRYGNDQLNVALLVLYLALYVIYIITHIEILYWISFVVIVFALLGGECQVFKGSGAGHSVVPSAPYDPPGQGALLF